MTEKPAKPAAQQAHQLAQAQHEARRRKPLAPPMAGEHSASRPPVLLRQAPDGTLVRAHFPDA